MCARAEDVPLGLGALADAATTRPGTTELNLPPLIKRTKIMSVGEGAQSPHAPTRVGMFQRCSSAHVGGGAVGSVRGRR